MTYSWIKRPKRIALIFAGVINAVLIYLIFRTYSNVETFMETNGDISADVLRIALLILSLGLFNVSLVVVFFWKKSSLVRAGLGPRRRQLVGLWRLSSGPWPLRGVRGMDVRADRPERIRERVVPPEFDRTARDRQGAGRRVPGCC